MAKIDGHEVPDDRVDEFYNGSDGSRVSDEQWDISRDREASSLDDLRALGFDYVGDELPEGHEIAKAVSDDGDLVTADD